MFKKSAAAYDLAHRFLQKGDVKNARIAMGIGDKFKGMGDRLKGMFDKDQVPQKPASRKYEKQVPAWALEMPEPAEISYIGGEHKDLTYAIRNEVERDGHKFMVVTLGIESDLEPAPGQPAGDFATLVFPIDSGGVVHYDKGEEYKDAVTRTRAARYHSEACEKADLLDIFGHMDNK